MLRMHDASHFLLSSSNPALRICFVVGLFFSFFHFISSLDGLLCSIDYTVPLSSMDWKLTAMKWMEATLVLKLGAVLGNSQRGLIGHLLSRY